MKPADVVNGLHVFAQPPSGGCVLKPPCQNIADMGAHPAAFGRLCVETRPGAQLAARAAPAAFGRLCVETIQELLDMRLPEPAAFGRLCVETDVFWADWPEKIPAAFGRLCVETKTKIFCGVPDSPSRLRAAVC